MDLRESHGSPRRQPAALRMHGMRCHIGGIDGPEGASPNLQFDIDSPHPLTGERIEQARREVKPSSRRSAAWPIGHGGVDGLVRLPVMGIQGCLGDSLVLSLASLNNVGRQWSPPASLDDVSDRLT
jgi:hypothetical protein